jgi:hypothetical protein
MREDTIQRWQTLAFDDAGVKSFEGVTAGFVGGASQVEIDYLPLVRALLVACAVELLARVEDPGPSFRRRDGVG